MYTVELFTEGVPTKEWVKRAERVKGAKQVCKGAGCLTRISAYNLDATGKPEKLCYKCQGNKEEQIKITRSAPRKGMCKHGHVLLDVGIKHGVCAACVDHKEYKRAKKKAEAEGRTYYPRKTYLVLGGLAKLMLARDVTCWSLGKELEISSRSIYGYAKDGVGCPPDRALKIANYFGVSVEELCNQGQEVAM